MKCKIVHCISDNIASDFYRLQLMGTESVKYENGFSKSPQEEIVEGNKKLEKGSLGSHIPPSLLTPYAADQTSQRLKSAESTRTTLQSPTSDGQTK